MASKPRTKSPQRRRTSGPRALAIVDGKRVVLFPTPCPVAGAPYGSEGDEGLALAARIMNLRSMLTSLDGERSVSNAIILGEGSAGAASA